MGYKREEEEVELPLARISFDYAGADVVLVNTCACGSYDEGECEGCAQRAEGGAQ